jgi:hypothetical protein
MALDFDGATQYIQIAQTKDLPIYNEVTYSVCGWVKAPAQDDKRIFAEGSSASNNPLLTIGSGRASDSTTDKLQVFIRNGAGSNLLGTSGTKSTTAIFDDAWHHFCWVDDNGTAKLYIDGALDATNFNYTRSGTFTLNRTGISAVIRAAVSHWLDGELFDIRCYNRCLSANEIAEIYHKRGADRVWQGLVGWWRLDDLPSGTPTPLLLDAMDATSGWGIYAGWDTGSVTLNTSIYSQGSGALNLIKSGGSHAWFGIEKTISATNVTGQDIKIDLYIKDSTTLNKIERARIVLSSAANNNFIHSEYNLAVGWNYLSVNIDDFTEQNTPDKSSIIKIYVQVICNNASDTLGEGDVVYDFYRAGDYVPNSIIDLSGNGNHGTLYGGTFQASPHRLRRGVLVS